MVETEPSAHWRKNGGKEPFRWFWNDSEFNGKRVNDIHLTNVDNNVLQHHAERGQ